MKKLKKMFTLPRDENNVSNATDWSDFPVLFRIMSSSPFWYRSVWAVALLFCCALSAYQVWDRVEFYLSEPIHNMVKISRNNTLQFPSVIGCANTWANKNLLKLRDNLSFHHGFDPCSNKGNSLFTYSEKHTVLNMTYFMDLAYVGDALRPECQFDPVGSSYSGTDNFCHSTNIANIVFTCTKLTADQPVKISAITKFKLLWDPPTDKCKNAERNSLLVIIEENVYDAMWIQWKLLTENLFIVEYKERTEEIIPLSVAEFTYLNTVTNPCTDGATFRKCFRKFIETCYKNAGIACSLPGFGPSELKLCQTIGESMKVMYELTLQFASADMPCPRRCKEIVFRRGLGRKERDNGIHGMRVSFQFLDNVITVSEEYYVYSLISLLCDVGGNIGLFLGVCLISVFEILEACLRNIMWPAQNK